MCEENLDVAATSVKMDRKVKGVVLRPLLCFTGTGLKKKVFGKWTKYKSKKHLTL